MKQLISGVILLMCVNVNAQTYNPQAAVAYANYWWDGRNTMNGEKSLASYSKVWGDPYHNYNTFNNAGDCANFVSQCLIEGGLDLKLGAYGVYNGTGEVDNKGCIKAAKELTMHLMDWRTDTEEGLSDYPLGDPAFLRDINNIPYHSQICAAVNGGQNLYNAHSTGSGGAYDSYQKTNSNNQNVLYFHIKRPILDHCGDCKFDPDKGEEGIDCGGTWRAGKSKKWR